MKELKYYNRIIDYLDNDNNKNSFEEELGENEELNKEYRATLAARKTTEYLALLEIDSILEKVKKNPPNEEKTKSNVILLRKRILSVAAIFLLLVGIVTIWQINTTESSSSLILENIIEPNMSMSRGNNEMESFEYAIVAYYKNDYTESINLLNEIKENSPLYIDSKYILGFNLLKKESFHQAVEAFEIVTRSENQNLKQSANWHLILALIGDAKVDKAVVQLDKIINNQENKYYIKAKELRAKFSE